MTDRNAASGAAIRHAPLRAPHRMAMGLAFLSDPVEWLVCDADRLADLREKRRLHARHAEQVFVETPPSRPAQREIRDALVDHLERHHPGRVKRSGSSLVLPELEERFDLAREDVAPLLLASWLVQEDLCLMEREDDAWRLSAASVCFPTRWDLPAKLGDTLTGIHDPVPGYREALGAPAERFFDALRPGRIAVRANWSLVDSPELFQPLHGSRDGARHVTHENVAETVWLRTERQTLRRFPGSDAILFTIRVLRDRLGALADRPERARLLAEDLRSMPEPLARYKSIPELREPVLAWLDRAAGEALIRPTDS